MLQMKIFKITNLLSGIFRWIPAESPYLPHKKWIEENFKGDGQRLQVVIFRSRNNVMTADNVREMFKLHKKVDALQSYNLTFKDFCHK